MIKISLPIQRYRMGEKSNFLMNKSPNKERGVGKESFPYSMSDEMR